MTRYYVRLKSIRPNGIPKSKWDIELRIVERSGIQSCREAAKGAVARGGWSWSGEVRKAGRQS